MLILFDIDGTLLQSNGVDEEAWVSAFNNVFGIKNINTDWGSYRNVTDSGIFGDIFYNRFGCHPNEHEKQLFIHTVVELIRQSDIKEVPGASQFLKHLNANGYDTAIASGCWREVATNKLARADVPVSYKASAFADDALERTRIMEIACTRAGVSSRAPITYFGDAKWDVRAARDLGMNFIGIACDRSQEDELRSEGAKSIFRDFIDFEVLLLHVRPSETG